VRGRPAGRRSVGFAEVPDFHVAVARRADPDLEGRSVLIGGDPAKRGKVVAASDDLKARGIAPGMPLGAAIERVPTAVWVQTDMGRARDLSGSFRAEVRRELEAVEVEGLGGVYIEAPPDRDEALALAARLETRVRETLGLPLRMGVAPARFAARLAAEDAGAHGARVIGPEDFELYLARLSIHRLPGIGPKTAARLAELGVVDVPGLRELGRERLEILLGNHGRSLWMLASGEDPKPLRVRRHPSTLSREATLSESDLDDPRLIGTLGRLAEHLEAALRRDGLGAARVALRLTFEDSRTVTRSQTLPSTVSSAGQLLAATRELLTRIEAEGCAFRKVALTLAGLEIQGAEDRQLDLF
jgi:DNA polymerase-4